MGYQGQLKETIQLYEDEARARSQIMEQVGISERKAAALSGELEESKALMDGSERAKRQLEMEIADGRNAVNNMQVINGKAAMAKLENKVHELEAELAGTQARTGESAKAYQRAERKCKELAFTAGEDKKNQDRMTDLASKLQTKIKTYKQQIEEAEEIAALNLAKFRKAQQELEEVEERAKLAALI